MKKTSLDMFQRSEQKISCEKHETFHFSASPKNFFFFAESRRMIFLGLIFFLTLFAGNAWGKVQSFETNLKEIQNSLFSDLQNIHEEVQQKGWSGIQRAFSDFEKELSEIAFFLEKTPQENTFFTNITSGFSSAHLFFEVSDILFEMGNILFEEHTYLEKISPKILKGEESLLPLFEREKENIEKLMNHMENAKSLIARILSSPLPEGIKSKLEQGKSLLEKAQIQMENITKYTISIETFLGKYHPQTILVLLQNKDEIRPTGGFIGSLLLLEISQGKILSSKFSDVYDFDGQLAKNIPPPKELSRLTKRWALRDANIFPDFPESAELIRWFLEEEKGPTADTIIAIHQGILEDILQEIDPVPLPGVNDDLFLTRENVSFLLSYIVEGKFLKEEEGISPKIILERLLPVLQQKIEEKENPEVFFAYAQSWIQKKDIQIYSRYRELEKLWDDLGISGKYLPEKSGKKTDFLGVVQMNVGGNKSDAFMTQNISEKTLLNLSGEMFHTLKISRKHTWDKNAEQMFSTIFSVLGSPYIPKEKIESTLGKGNNVVSTTVYFPKGTRLLTSKNISFSDIKRLDEAEYTAFRFLFPKVPAGEERDIELFVESPLKINVFQGEVFEFYALHQAGSERDTFSKDFLYETGISVKGEVFHDQEFSQNISTAYLAELKED
ncbi:DUF4012 domain-containing protein [Candidatus Peregrinibacteria bacterium]|nr:DUF4012 domain-containing protein [Candidatus Peregrinibacteria bacterium]